MQYHNVLSVGELQYWQTVPAGTPTS